MKPLSAIASVAFAFLTMGAAIIAPHVDSTMALRLAAFCAVMGALCFVLDFIFHAA